MERGGFGGNSAVVVVVVFVVVIDADDNVSHIIAIHNQFGLFST